MHAAERAAPRAARPSLSSELSGGFADLGVLIPLEAALVGINGLNPTTTFLGVGLAYILAGRYFGIPMPVQPLKAFAAIAIATQASPGMIAGGALGMGLLLAGLAVTGAVDRLARWTPIGVIRGVQLGLALLLLKNGWEFVASRPFALDGARPLLWLGGEAVSWNVPVALVGALLLLALLRWPRVPAALAVLVFGGVASLVALGPGTQPALALGPAPWVPAWPTPDDLLLALPLLVVPQLPLTLANSVVATSDAASSYFGERARRATPRAVTLSIALGNLWAALAGGLPICHGCGGLTAHYRLGARTPLATAILGALLIGVGLLFGAAALQVRSLVPYPIYGVLLAYVGFEHLKLGWTVPHRAARLVAIVTALASLAAGGNLAVGAAVGLLAATGVRLARRLRPLAPSLPR